MNRGWVESSDQYLCRTFFHCLRVSHPDRTYHLKMAIPVYPLDPLGDDYQIRVLPHTLSRGLPMLKRRGSVILLGGLPPGPNEGKYAGLWRLSDE